MTSTFPLVRIVAPENQHYVDIGAPIAIAIIGFAVCRHMIAKRETDTRNFILWTGVTGAGLGGAIGGILACLFGG